MLPYLLITASKVCGVPFRKDIWYKIRWFENNFSHTHTFLNDSLNFPRLNYNRWDKAWVQGTAPFKMYAHIRSSIAFEHTIGPNFSEIEINHQWIGIQSFEWEVRYRGTLLLNQLRVKLIDGESTYEASLTARDVIIPATAHIAVINPVWNVTNVSRIL